MTATPPPPGGGPLLGLVVVELAAQGPGPFAAMMLADLGADVIRVDRVGSVRAHGAGELAGDVLNRGRRSIAIDLKQPAGAETLLRLVERADALIEGFRPGVTERLGVGPDVCAERNRRLVYGRMTGWGQEGPYASMAGHDINYIALAGTLGLVGRDGDPPVPPVNLVGDYGGGLLLAYGIVAALWEAARSGRGQVIDCAMVDGAAILSSLFFGLVATGAWSEQRGTNMLDGGAPFYDVYETADGGYVTVGSIEPRFYAELLERLGLEANGDQMDRAAWPELKRRIAETFRTRTRDQWCALLDGTDVCFAPVLGVREAPEHPHARARGSFVEIAGVVQPAPAPRFSRTHARVGPSPAAPGEHTDQLLAELGLAAAEIEHLKRRGAVASHPVPET